MKSSKSNPDKHRQGHRKRLRDQYLSEGIDSLSDTDIVELLLTVGRPRQDMRPQAKEILKQFKTLHEVFNADKEDLISFSGVKEHAAFGILFTAECYKRALKQNIKTKKIRNSKDAVDEIEKNLCPSIGSLKDEHVYSIFLNNAGSVLELFTVSEGTVGQADVYPRKIMERALLKKASSVILIHNHPSQNPEPSQADVILTEKIEKILSGIEISLLDHIIVTEKKAYSFRENGLLG
ncbi:RadC family protein [candidate division WOR-3 bacterium]|nr:RadC family protein [candidate division WOR-3 bacterium]